MDKATMDALRKPFPKEQIGKLPRAGIKLDYVGHAAVTDRLNQATDGEWTYTIDKLFDHKNDTYVEGTMTIAGVSRVEYGDGKNPKEAVSNFIRRAAMRFGVAIDLWSKEELLEASPVTDDPAARTSSRGRQEDTSAGAAMGESPAEREQDLSRGEVAGPAPSGSHVHQWIPSPRLSKYEVCSVEGCFETKKKGAAA